MVEASGSSAQILEFARALCPAISPASESESAFASASPSCASVLVLHDRLSSQRSEICNSSCLRDELFGYVAAVDGLVERRPYRALHAAESVVWPLWQLSSREHGRATTRFDLQLGRLLLALAFLLPGAPRSSLAFHVHSLLYVSFVSSPSPSLPLCALTNAQPLVYTRLLLAYLTIYIEYSSRAVKE